MKNIVCFGDSNTHGYNPSDCSRYNSNLRWTGVVQKELGSQYHIIEEGLCGRTCVYDDPAEEGISAIDYIYPCLMSHKKIDLIIVMLGTNDTKERYSANAYVISLGMKRLIKKIQSIKDAFTNDEPNILIVAPLPIKKGILNTDMVLSLGKDCIEKSRDILPLYKDLAEQLKCHYLDISDKTECSDDDFVHLSIESHQILANELAIKIKQIFS